MEKIMQENNLKLEFKDFVTELSTDITKQILNEDIKKFTDEHRVNIKKYHDIFNKLYAVNDEFKSTSIGLYESKEVLQTYNKQLNENSKYVVLAINELESWKNDIKEEIVTGYKDALAENLASIKQSNEEFCKNLIESFNNELRKEKEIQKNQVVEILKGLGNEKDSIQLKEVVQVVSTLNNDINSLKAKINSMYECQRNTAKDIKVINEAIIEIKYK